MKALRYTLRGFLHLAAWPVAFACALLVSVYFHQSLPIAKRVAASTLASLASEEITGTLAVGSIEAWGPDGIVFNHVLLFDPEGHRIVRARRLTLVPDWQAALRGEVRFASAKLEGGVADLIDAGDGLPTLVNSFDSPYPDTDDDDGEALEVVVDGIQIEHLRLRGDLLGLQGIVARRVHARGRLVIGEEVRVTIEQARGRVVRPFGFEGRVDSLTGTISTAATEGVDLFAATRRDDQHADAHVIYRAPAAGASDELDLRVEGDNLAPDTLRDLGFDWLPPLRLPVAGWARLRGPLEALTVEAAITTEAGDARIDGTLSEQDGFAVTVQTDGMELARALEDAPDIRAAGSLEVEAAADEAEPRVHAEVEPLAFGKVAVPKLVIDGVLGSQGIRVTRVRTEQRGGVITGRGQLDDDGGMSFSLRARVANVKNDPNLSKLLPGAEGRLEANLTVRSPNLQSGRLSFRGRLVLHDARYGLLSAKKLVLEGSARGDPERPALNLKVTGSGVRVGEYELGDATLGVTGGPKKYAATGSFESGGKRTFNLDATVLAEKRGFVVDAEQVEVVVGDGAWRGALRGLRVVGDDVVELEMLRLADRSQRLEAHGIVRFDGEDSIDASLQDFDLAALRAILGEAMPLSEGRADATVNLTGDVEKPVLMVQGALRGGRVMHIDDLNALYMVSYADGDLEVDGEVDMGERGLLRISGLGDVDATIADPREALLRADYDLELEAEEVSLALVPELEGTGVAGRISAQLALQGTLARPRVRGPVELSPLDLPGWGSFVVLSETDYADRSLALRLSIGDVGGPLATASGRLALDLSAAIEDPGVVERALREGPWELSGRTLERRLDRMPTAIALVAPYPAVLTTKLNLHKRDGVTGGDASFELGITETIEGSECAEEMDAHVQGTLVLEGGSTRIDARTRVGKRQAARIRGTAETPVDAWMAGRPITQPALFQASAKLDIREIARLPFLCEYGRGRLEGEIELDGGIATEPLLVAELRSEFLPRVLRPTGTRKRVKAETCGKDPMVLRLGLQANRQDLALEGTLSGCHGGDSEVAGTVPIAWDALHVLPLPDSGRDMAVRARFESAQLKPLLDRIPGVINSNAIAVGELELSGPVDDPQTRGTLDMRGAELYLIATGQRLTNIDASFEFMGQLARVKQLKATAGEGTLSSTGSISLDGFWPERANMGLSLEEFPLQQEGVDLAWLDGTAAVDAEIRETKTRAAFKLHELTVTLPDASDRTLQPLEPHPDVIVVTREEPERAEPYPVELVIDGRRPFRVLRDDFDMTITAEVALGYMDPDLNVGGEVRFEQGEFEMLGKRFDIESGTLRFDGTNRVDPEIILVARHQPLTVGAAPIGVSVIGTLSEPEVTFSSDECPGDEAAATYLISGRCDADDPLAAAEAEDAENAFAAGLVGSIGGALTPWVRGQMSGLGPRLAFESTGEDARLKAGIVTDKLVPEFMRPLVQRVYVQGAVSTDLRDDELGAAESASQNTISTDLLIELYFPHNLVGSGKVAAGGNWGLDVTWEP